MLVPPWVVGVGVILLFWSVCRLLLFILYSVLFIDARSWTASPDLSDSSSRLSSDAGEPPNKKLCVTKQRGEYLFYTSFFYVYLNLARAF